MLKISKYRLTTPEGYPPRIVFIVSIMAMSLLFVFDLTIGVDIRLHVLYVFPLAAIALHCDRMVFVMAGMLLSLFCQLFNSLAQGYSNVALKADAIIFLLAAALVVYLARAVRDNYLDKERQASTDWLTGLHNRRSFDSILQKEIDRHNRSGGVFSLALIDLDNFKALNDTQGHFAGDLALKRIAAILKISSREPDVIARLGGDEFAILMPATRHEDCHELCAKLTKKIAKHMADAGYEITASIGCSSFEGVQKSTSSVLQEADNAMYAVKSMAKSDASEPASI